MKHGSLKSNLKKILHLDGSPDLIAAAFAFGVFVSFSPFYFLHSIIALGFAYLFRLNVPAVMVGAWLNNPLTTPFVYLFCYNVGKFMIGGTLVMGDVSWKEMLTTHFGAICYQLLLGCTLVGAFAAFVSFFAVKIAVIKFRARHARAMSLPALDEK